MSLIQQLQDDIINPDISLASILRRSRILAYRLGHDELKTWVDNELNGYPDNDSIPSYRRFTAHNYGDFYGPFDYHAKNVPIAVIDLADTIKDLVQEVVFGESIGVVEDMMNNPGMREHGAIKFSWPQEAVKLANLTTYKGAVERGTHLVSAWRNVGSNDTTRVLEAVRNKLLAFVLELQDQFPELTESNDKIGDIPLDQTNNIFHMHIHGNQNVVAAGTNVTQDVRQVVRSGDISSLLGYLKSIGVSEEDTQELKEAVEADGPREESAGLGPRVRDWLGKKAAEGALNATMSSVAMTTAKAVAQYYGWLA